MIAGTGSATRGQGVHDAGLTKSVPVSIFRSPLLQSGTMVSEAHISPVISIRSEPTRRARAPPGFGALPKTKLSAMPAASTVTVQKIHSNLEVGAGSELREGFSYRDGSTFPEESIRRARRILVCSSVAGSSPGSGPGSVTGPALGSVVAPGSVSGTAPDLKASAVSLRNKNTSASKGNFISRENLLEPYPLVVALASCPRPNRSRRVRQTRRSCRGELRVRIDQSCEEVTC